MHPTLRLDFKGNANFEGPAVSSVIKQIFEVNDNKELATDIVIVIIRAK